jgi:hypothetical protein
MNTPPEVAFQIHHGAKTWEVDAEGAKAMIGALENCRALAQRMMRHHPESAEWAAVLRFCHDAGFTGNPLR